MRLLTNTGRLCSRLKSSIQIPGRTLVLVRATKADKKEASKLVEDVFFKQDPTSVMSGVAEKARISYILTERTLDCIDENLSFMAKDSETDARILGIVINGARPIRLDLNYMEDLIHDAVCPKEKTLLQFWKYIAHKPINQRAFFGNDKEFFEIRYLTVHPSAQRRGIAKALADKSRQEARDKGFKYIRIECTSAHSARIAKCWGMKCVFKLDYCDYKDVTGSQIFKSPIHPHTSVRVFVEEVKD